MSLKLNNLKNKFKKYNLLIFLSLFLLAAYSQDLAAKDKIIAIVNNEVVTQKDLDEFFNFLRLQSNQKEPFEENDEKASQLRKDLLEKLIEERLLLQEAKKNSISVQKSFLKNRIDAIRSQFPSDSDFRSELFQRGLTQADLEKKLSDQYLIQEYIERKIKNSILVSPAEVTKFYQQHLSEFILPQQRICEIMSFKDEKLANTVYEELKTTGDFTKVGIDYGIKMDKVGFYENELKEDVKKIIFSLSEGEFSAPLEVNKNEFYIFRLVEIIPARQQSLAEAQEKINAYLYNLKINKALSEKLEELKSKSYVKVYEEDAN